MDEPGLAEAENEDDFETKLDSLKVLWERNCQGFHKWFLKNRKKIFQACVITSARKGTEVNGMYYQNDVESLHAIEKRVQGFTKMDVLGAIKTVQVMEREDNDERVAMYEAGNYILTPACKIVYQHRYKQFRLCAHVLAVAAVAGRMASFLLLGSWEEPTIDRPVTTVKPVAVQNLQP